ncbi:MAG: hypothetical protein MSG64_01780 [Pyrinomonadaceae bacterium MAG19_C2-C3]|nr:hypothetical protein [Pyrinomonadaceae bacterium MAG19_C2-C3]
MSPRAQSRINIRLGDADVKGSGLEYALSKHLNSGKTNKSQFTISRQEVIVLLESKEVIAALVTKSATYNSYVREVDVRRVIGRTPQKLGGEATSVVTVITDDAGNLINVFPGKLNFGAK